MTPEVAARAFEPFFTTKETGRGAGLGLSTVYGIANRSGGSVSISTTSGMGTTITVLFPLSTNEAGRRISHPAHMHSSSVHEEMVHQMDETLPVPQ